jgi:hypothetical protein
MKGLLNQLISFYSWQTDTISDRILEVITKLWITGLFILFVIGWTSLVVHWIMNPNMWDGVQFGIYDTLGT